MKKVITLLMLSLIWAGSSWAVTVQVGSGTGTSAFLPIRAYYGYTYSQQIYTQAQIATTGTINKIRFYLSSGNLTNSSAWVVYLGHTTKTSFTSTSDWVPVASLTEVYNGTVTFPAVGNWMEITLTTTFNYNNTDNLIVAVDENTPGYAPADVYWGAFTSGNNTGIYYYNDGTNPNPAAPPTGNSLTSTIDQIQFDIIPPGTPALLAVPSSLDFGYVAFGNSSLEQNYVLSGTNLTAGPIVVTAPAGFGVSLVSGGPYTGSLNVVYSPPTLPNTTIYAKFTPPGANTFYSGNITNAGGGASTNVAVSGSSNLFGMYCTSAAYYTGDEDITKVAFGSFLNNTTPCASLTGSQGTGTGTADKYSNFTNAIAATNVNQGAMVPVTVTITECGGTAYDHSVNVYIDFNQNGLLTDTGEEFIIWAFAIGGLTNIINANIPVPIGATLGNTLMRVVCVESDIIGPCNVDSWGETEDYRVNILPAILGTMQGHVYDAQGGCITPTIPLASATVSNGTYTTTTNGSGFYQFTIPVGTYSFTASKAGFVNQVVNGIVITQGNTTTQDFCLDPFLAPPSCLDATLTGQDVHLSWSPPNDPPEQWLMWDDGTNTNAIGSLTGGTFSVASRWPVSDIAPYDGMYLNKIRIYANDVTATYTLKVWEGADAATLLLSQPVTPVLGWNEFNLSSSVPIDGTQDFWFGYEVTFLDNTYPAGCDNGPNIEGKGNMILWAGTWTTLYLLSTDLTFNWNIHGWIAPCAPYGPPPPLNPLAQGQENATVKNAGILKAVNTRSNLLQAPAFELQTGQTDIPGASQHQLMSPLAPLLTLTGYNVYRNNVLMASNIPELFYDDAGLPEGSYDYEVSAQYDFGESAKAGPVHVDIILCPAPTLQTANVITAAGADLGWTDPLGSFFDLFICPSGDPAPVSTTSPSVNDITDNPYTWAGGNPSTTYDWYVRTDCGQNNINVSTWTGPNTFTTLCVDLTLPYCESFDGTVFAPVCWTNMKTAGNGIPGTWDRQTTGLYPSCYPHSGAGMSRYNSFNLSAGTAGILVTPSYTLPILSQDYRVRFWMYRDNGYSSYADLVNVYFNTAPNLTGATILGTINRSSSLAPVVAANGWYEYSFAMPAGQAGSGRYAILEAVSQYGNNMFVDDLCINHYCTWTGLISNSWMEPGNWTCGIVPNHDVVVVIPASPAGPNFPVIANGVSAECFEIIVDLPGTLTVQSGGTLHVMNP